MIVKQGSTYFSFYFSQLCEFNTPSARPPLVASLFPRYRHRICTLQEERAAAAAQVLLFLFPRIPPCFVAIQRRSRVASLRASAARTAIEETRRGQELGQRGPHIVKRRNKQRSWDRRSSCCGSVTIITRIVGFLKEIPGVRQFDVIKTLCWTLGCFCNT